MEKKKLGLTAFFATSLACLPQTAISDDSKIYIERIFQQLEDGTHLAQWDDFDEYFLDQPSGPWGEQQWFEHAPEWSEMYPDGSYRGSKHDERPRKTRHKILKESTTERIEDESISEILDRVRAKA